MVDYARVVEFIHELYDNSEFVPWCAEVYR